MQFACDVCFVLPINNWFAVLDNGKPIIDWQYKTNITGKLQIEIGDYLIDEVRDKYNINLSFGEMDEIANKCIEVAKIRYK